MGKIRNQIASGIAVSFFALTASGCLQQQLQDSPSSSSSSSARGPDDMRYSANPARYPIGEAISENVLISGYSLKNISITPTLPAGLSFDTATGKITGTPTTITSAAEYVIRAQSGGGTGYVKLNLAVTEVPPTISYGGLMTQIFTVGTGITTITPVLGGGPLASCSSTPSLPAGLSLSAACVITGTPSAPVAATNYLISASNSGGTATLSFNFTVKDLAPNITYTPTSHNFYRSQAITTITPSNSGGAVTSCSSSPSLPSGLSLSSGCSISGTPSAVTASAVYTLTATNSGGTSAKTLTLEVFEPAPSISYSPNSRIITKNSAMTTMNVVNTGGTIVSCSSSPALPTGITIDATCKISGTPSVISGLTAYSITATNTTGSSTTTVNLTVNDLAPTLSYSGSPYVFTRGSAITTQTPTNSGGTITSCSSSPNLTTATGLSLSSSCVISGTPSSVAATATYTITGTNSGGSVSTTISVTVNDTVPNLTYAGNPFTFVKNSSVGTITPTNSGGTVTSCSVSPSLPAGLSLSTTCVITGTPTAVTAAANYTLTATNSGGTQNQIINIAVNDILPVFSYTGSPYTFTKNSAITTQTPTNTGGAITSCSSSPTLPAGLSLSVTCVISGTPTTAQAATAYTISGTNSAGTATAAINIQVNEIAPVISYTGSPYSFTKNTMITTQTPTNTGGTATSCASSPTLPTGLSLSATCVISGTPTVVTGAANYTITATNASGTGSATINIAVNDTAPAIDYIPTSYNFTYTKDTLITNLTPNSTGGTITGCTVSPSLPTGLSISGTTCTISGTPTAVRAATDYTITATNSGGTASQIITITVNDVAPGISYAGSPFTYTKNSAITTLTPTNSGGTIVSCSASPTLPAGLTLSNLCVISGTPNTVTATATYTITATNSGGTSSASISVTVNDVAPSALSYTGDPYTYTKGVAITTQTPTHSGGTITSCSSSPSLPAGLSLSSTCVLSGTPSAIAATATYTITATNSGGSTTDSVQITVNDAPPILTYTGTPYTFTKGSAITTVTPTNTGGDPTSCGSVPALPAGLSLSNNCAISGTPSAVTAAASYTITGTNTGGSDAETINITVNDVAPTISFSPSAQVFTLRTAISTITPSNSGGTPTSCSSSPTLPTGLSISNTCQITGTPTAITTAADYTITATNTGGSSSSTLNIRVKNQPVIVYYGLTALDGSTNGSAPSSLNIWKATIDGVDRTALTSISGASRDSESPSFVPGGSQITYVSKRALDGTAGSAGTGSFNVWRVSTAGAHSNLTSNTSASLDSGTAPRFSPDGSKIAFASKMALDGSTNGTPTSSTNIWIMNSDGSGKFALTQNSDAGLDSIDPVFTPDGSTVVFSSRTDSTGSWNGTPTLSDNIWKVATNGTGRSNLTAQTSSSLDSYEPNVSPDGTSILFASKMNIGGSTANSYNIWKMNIDGTGKVNLTGNLTAGLDSRSPKYSQDGTEIVFQSKMNVNGSTANSYNIWKMTSAGASQTGLTLNNSANLDSIGASFSSDGTKVVFSSKQDVGGNATSSANIWVMNSDGTGLPTAITTNTSSGLDCQLAPGSVWYAE